MKYTVKSIALLLFIGMIASCGSSSKLKMNQEYDLGDGLKLTYFKHDAKQLKLDSSDVALMYYKGVLDDGTEFGSNYGSDPLKFEVGKGMVIKGWDMALPSLNKGDSAKIYVPYHLAYGEAARGEIIPAKSNLTFYVTVVDVKQEPQPFNVEGLDTMDLGDGLKYIQIKKGKGISIQKNHKVSINYTGYFLDGKIFDSSVGKESTKPFDFVVGRGFVIKGWDLGLVGRQRGELGKLIIPYELAYGKEGRVPSIPAEADLIFDIEILDLKVLPVPTPYLGVGHDTLQTVSGLRYYKIKKNDALPVSDGKTVVIDYSGYLTNGDLFDSSVERGDSLVVPIGKMKLIPGFTEALKLMREGEKMRAFIPYQLAYGEKGIPPIIPPKADLIFDIHVKNIR